MILVRDRYSINMAKFSLIFFGIFAYFLLVGMFQSNSHFLAIAYLLLLFLLTFVPLLIVINKDFSIGTTFILIPTLLVSFDIFFLRMGLFNIYSYLDGSLFEVPSLESIKKATILVLAGNLAMWMGFFWPVSKKLSMNLGNKLNALTSFRTTPKIKLIWLFFFIGIFTRMYLVKKGIGGFFSEKSLREAALPYIQFLLLIENLSTLSIVSYFCVLLKGSEKQKKWFPFVLMFLVEIFTLIFIGFKGQILYRFFYLTVTYVFITKKFPAKFVISGFLVLILITPLNLIARDKYLSGNIETGNFADIKEGFLLAGKKAFSGTLTEKMSTLSYYIETIVRISARMENLSLIVEHIDRNNIKFYGKDYLSILTWFVPRAIWASKPIHHKGEWVRVEVYGRSAGTSAPQTVPGDFYMNFGTLGVVIGFFLFGFLQRSISTGLLEISSLRFLPLIPFVIFGLAQPQSDFGPHIAGTIKYLILNYIFLFFMFPKVKKSMLRNCSKL